MPKTMFEKIWDAHIVREVPGESTILYIDRHLVHEMTSPQAFAGLRMAHREVHRPDATVAVLDHNVPTVQGRKLLDVVDKESLECLTTMESNARDFGLTLYTMNDARQGIVHIIGPEQGITLPGMTIVCGDSHTSTHGALGALAFGIGTSEVEHVLATQCLLQQRPKTMNIRVEGKLFARYNGQRPGALHHWSAWDRRGYGPCHRIQRLCHSQPLDGGTHDAVQSRNRDGRSGGYGRPRRNDLRLYQRTPLCPEG